MTRTLAHLSDLHLGASRATETAARSLVESLLATRIDHVVLTGDVTHQGRLDEHDLFLETFAPLARQGRLSVVPGNHDRGTDDVAQWLTRGQRVWTEQRDGLYLVCVDTTAPHNKRPFRAHGALEHELLSEIDFAVGDAPKGAVVAVLLHHHPIPLPVEGVGEWFAHALGWPHAGELELGRALLGRLQGRADLVLHGHRHTPRRERRPGPRLLQVVNAGSSTELGAYRVFRHRDGVLQGAPEWQQAGLAPRTFPVGDLAFAPA